MEQLYSSTPRAEITISGQNTSRAFEGWRHAIGHGGINRYPLPPRVQRGLAALRPRLVRTFIQEYFNVYPEPGVYDWSLLDPYMDSLAASGGKVVACICIKPPVLYPQIDQRIIMPNDISQWQDLIEAMVRRYSIEKNIVTHWEIANESDIGENGGCPYHTKTPAEYNAYYRITAEAILRVDPSLKIGGLGLADAYSPLMEGLLKYCAENDLRLDFVSWHRYTNSPSDLVACIRHCKALLAKYYGDNPPEMLITELSKSFDETALEESAFDPTRAAIMAALIFAMLDEGVDYSFYYHIWDQTFVADHFRPFFADLSIMLIHWNEIPHRFGMFGVCGEVRPVYFAYKMIEMLGDQTLTADSNQPDILVKSATDGNAVNTMLVNHNTRNSRDMVSVLRYSELKPGIKLLTVYRVDKTRHWDEETLALKPVERRYIDVLGDYRTNILCPADTVTFVSIADSNLAAMEAELLQMQ